LDTATLSQLLSLKSTADPLTFQNLVHRRNSNNALFGGQVLAQALLAACKTVEKRPAHSLHAYFLRAGSDQKPVNYEVERSRDGGSISSRRVKAVQDDHSILNLAASFQEPEESFEHACEPTGEVADADELELTIRSSNQVDLYPHLFGLEFKDLQKIDFQSPEMHDPSISYWVRMVEPIDDSLHVQQAALAYISDMRLLSTAMLPHPTSMTNRDILIASIDHALWFHSQDFHVNDWLLFQLQSPWSGGGRGFSRANIFNRKLKLIASTAQEGIIRRRKAQS